MAPLVKLLFFYSSVLLLLLAVPIKCQYEKDSMGFFGSPNGPERQNDQSPQQQEFAVDDQLAYEDRGPDDYFEYEKKILRARAYMDLLSMTSSVAEEPSPLSANWMIESSHKIANPSAAALSFYSPMQSDLSAQSNSFYYYGDQFSWMRPYEFFECDQQ